MNFNYLIIVGENAKEGSKKETAKTEAHED